MVENVSHTHAKQYSWCGYIYIIKIDFKTRSIIRYLIMIKVSIYKENIVILNVHDSEIKTCQMERKGNGSIIFMDIYSKP